MRKAQYLEIILITSCIIGALGWLTIRSFSPLRPKNWQRELTQNNSASMEVAREPSSEGGRLPPPQGGSQPGATVVIISCAKQQNVEIESTTPFVRVRTVDCAKHVVNQPTSSKEGAESKSDEFKESDVTVTNLTTGYTATVVTLPDGNHTTDFIDLNVGKNQILVSIGELNKETFSQEFSVTYTAP